MLTPVSRARASIPQPAKSVEGTSLAGAMSWSGLGSAITYVTTVVSNVAIARAVAPTALGDLSYLVWLLSTANQLLPLSVPYATSVYIGAHLGSGHVTRARAIYQRGLWLTAGLAALGALVWMLAGRRWMPVALRSPWGTLFAVLMISTVPLSSALQGWATGSMDYRAVAMGNMLGGVAFAAGALAAWLTRSILVAFAAYAGRALVVALWWAPAAFRTGMATDLSHPSQDTRLLRPFWPLALEHWVMLLGYVLVWSRSDLALLNWLATPTEIAHFNVASQLSAPVLMATTFFTAPLALYAARSNTFEGRARLGSAVGSILRLSGTISGLAALAGAATAPVIVPLLFGPAYAEAARIVPLLAFAAWAYAQVSIYSALSCGLERPRYSLASMGAGGAVLLGVALLLVPSLGAAGAAVARAATQAVSLLLIWYLVSSLLPSLGDARGALRPMLVFGLPLFGMSMAVTCMPRLQALAMAGLLGAGSVFAAKHVGVLYRTDLSLVAPRLQHMPRSAGRLARVLLTWFAA